LSLAHSITSPPVLTIPAPLPTTTHKCTSKERFGLVCVDPSPTSPMTPTDSPSHRQQCVRRSWFGFCKKWEDIEEGWALRKDWVQEI
jgi:lipase ATG15